MVSDAGAKLPVLMAPEKGTSLKRESCREVLAFAFVTYVNHQRVS